MGYFHIGLMKVCSMDADNNSLGWIVLEWGVVNSVLRK